MNLAQRTRGHFNADTGSGFRANTADFDSSLQFADRGSFGAEQDPTMDASQSPMAAPKSQPHSSSGFRRALEHTERSNSRLGQLTNKSFGGKSYTKPNAFAQGQRRHGMHIGSGAPAIIPGNDTGADTGE